MSVPTPTQKLGLNVPALRGTGEPIGTYLETDLLTLEHGTTVISEMEPMLPHDGLFWWDSINEVLKIWSDTAEDWLLVALGGDDGLTEHIASNPATHAAGSITATHLASNAVTAAKIASDAVTTAKILNANVTAAKLGAGAADDTAVGNRTLDDTLATPADTGPLTSLLSWLAGRIKAITGESGWKTAPATTLLAAKGHADSAAPHSGHATAASVATAVSAHNTAQGAHGLYSGSGSPEGVVTAPVGSWYRDILTGNRWRKASGALAVGWILGESSMQSFARVRKSSSHATSNGTTTVSWSTEMDDTDNIWDSGSPTRFVVPTGFAGRWRATLKLGNYDTDQVITFRKNGSTDVFKITAGRGNETDTQDSTGSGTTIGLGKYVASMKLAEADYLEVRVTDSSVRSWDADQHLPQFEFEYLGPTN